VPRGPFWIVKYSHPIPSPSTGEGQGEGETKYSTFLKAGSAKRGATPLSFQRKTLFLEEEGRVMVKKIV